MTASKSNRTRAVAKPYNAVGKLRSEMYKAAYARIKEASKAGFHLEAIAIIESIVSDRLESRLTYVLGRDFSFQHLGSLIVKARQVETDQALRKLVDQGLSGWRISRNAALHEMAKMAEGDRSTWQDRVNGLVPVAESGLKLLRAIDKRIAELR